MIDFRRVSAASIPAAFVLEERRHAEPPSLMSRDFDMPAASSPAPPSGYWPRLCWLTAGSSPLAIAAWRLLYAGVLLERCGPCSGSGRRGRKRTHCLACNGAGTVGAVDLEPKTGAVVACRATIAQVATALGASAAEVRRDLTSAMRGIVERLAIVRASEMTAARQETR